MSSESYVANQLLSRLVGRRMYSVEFVLNDYVQLRFDGDLDSDNPVVLNYYAWPVIETARGRWQERDLGYADSLRKLTPGSVLSTQEATGVGLRIVLETGTVVVNPETDQVGVEIALLQGFADGAWMVWRPGDEIFENLR